MAISEPTREAIFLVMRHYMKSGWPLAWMGYSRLPEEVEAVTGFQYGYVMGDRKSITIVDAPPPLKDDAHLSDGVTIPFMPFASSGHPNTVPPSFVHPFKLLVGIDEVARLHYNARAGKELIRAAKNSVNDIKHPVIIFELTRWKAPKEEGGGWACGLSIRPKELEGLITVHEFTPQGKTNARSLGLHGERAGALAIAHEGRIEFYGSEIPCVIRSHDEAVVSILMAPTPAEVLAATNRLDQGPKSEEPPVKEQRLPGFEEEEEQDGEESQQGEGQDEGDAGSVDGEDQGK